MKNCLGSTRLQPPKTGRSSGGSPAAGAGGGVGISAEGTFYIGIMDSLVAQCSCVAYALSILFGEDGGLI